MYGVCERILLRHLVETDGLMQTAAAHQLGVQRKTLQRWIADGLLDAELDVITARYGPRAPVPTKLEAVKPLIAARLAEFPRLSAQRLFVECRAAGNPGANEPPRPKGRGIVVGTLVDDVAASVGEWTRTGIQNTGLIHRPAAYHGSPKSSGLSKWGQCAFLR